VLLEVVLEPDGEQLQESSAALAPELVQEGASLFEVQMASDVQQGQAESSVPTAVASVVQQQ
jgi:hypothetical protein